MFVNEYDQPIDIENNERAEQDLLRLFIKRDDVVLELGARYGTTSCVINKNLKVKTNQVSVEPDDRVWEALEKNKLHNECSFHIVKGFISNKTLALANTDVCNGYGTTSVPAETSNIPSFSLEQIQQKYGLNFTVVVADCEGFLETFLEENNKLYEEIRMIIFEIDYCDKCNYVNIIENLEKHNFHNIIDTGHQMVWMKLGKY